MQGMMACKGGEASPYGRSQPLWAKPAPMGEASPPPYPPQPQTMPSPSQNRRNASQAAPAPAVPVDPAAAAVPDLDALLSSLDAAEWAPPAVEKTAAAATGAPPVEWSAPVLALAESAGVSLPFHQPKKPGVLGLRYLMAHAPKDLRALNAPVQTTLQKRTAGGVFLLSLIHGRFTTSNGIIPIPSLAAGDSLPVVVLLKCLSKVPEMVKGDNAVNYLSTLYDRGPGCILAQIAKFSGRYAYIDGESIRLSDSLKG